jgi:MFS family permease
MFFLLLSTTIVFGMSQFLFQTPAGYLYDYSDQKVLWLSAAAISTTLLTVATACLAQPAGGNLSLMIFIKFLQGAVTSFIPPGLNSITQGIVGANGMTQQVAINEMMNHLGTAIIVLVGSLLGVWLYPSLGSLFVVSPIACAGLLFFLNKIDPADIDHNEARGLVTETFTSVKPSSSSNSKPPGTPNEYTPPSDAPPASDASGKVLHSQPSFNFGWQSVMGSVGTGGSNVELKADSPLRVLRDPILLTFILMCFLFHMANGTVLPLVMQTVAIGSGREGILLSGLCIIVAQIFMVLSAKVCGTYSGKHGRKPLFLVGLLSVPVRCLLLTLLLHIRGEDNEGSFLMNCFILSTQVLDGVGAGVFGTMYILVTSDISGGTGRFSMTLGLTTAAMSIGGTVSGYLGEALAQDLGYQQAYFILMFLSMIPAGVYLFFMPETLPALVKAKAAGMGRMASLAEGDEEEHHDADPNSTSYNQLT